jgi:hypothetical protein
MSEAAALTLIYSSFLVIPFLWLYDFIRDPMPRLRELERLSTYLLYVTIDTAPPQWPAPSKTKARRRSSGRRKLNPGWEKR